MKSVLVLAALLSAPMAFAQNQSVDANTDDQVYELEVGAMPYEEAQALNSNMELNRRDRDAEVAIGVIGGIIGSIIDNNRPDRGHGGPGGPGHGGPGGPGHGGPGGPGHGGPGFPGGPGGWDRDYICYARDHRGNVYRAVGSNPRRVQDRALDKCDRNSRFCRPQGCQRV